MKIKIANIAGEDYGRMRICYNGPGKHLTAECKLAVEEIPYTPKSRKDAENAIMAMYNSPCWGLIWYQNKIEDALYSVRTYTIKGGADMRFDEYGVLDYLSREEYLTDDWRFVDEAYGEDGEVYKIFAAPIWPYEYRYSDI